MAAEILHAPDYRRRYQMASMRPRRMAAEMRGIGHSRSRRLAGFNEAAANGRGNAGRAAPRAAGAAASMRPRRMAAEIVGPRRDRHRGPPASMRPRRMAAEMLAADRMEVRGADLLQ